MEEKGWEGEKDGAKKKKLGSSAENFLGEYHKVLLNKYLIIYCESCGLFFKRMGAEGSMLS